LSDHRRNDDIVWIGQLQRAPRALSDPDWQTASQALDDLMRKLLVVHRLLEAEERLAKRELPAAPT
jgi:hypothetical protein